MKKNKMYQKLNSFGLVKGIYQAIIVSSFLVISGCQSTGEQTNSPQAFTEDFLIGPFGDNPQEGIHLASLTTNNKAVSKLTDKGIVAQLLSPSYAAFNEKQTTMFTVDGLDNSGISVFGWQNNQQTFKKQQSITDLSEVACHISRSPNNAQVAMASYSSGDIHLFTLDGGKLTLTDHYKNQGSGPHPHQKGPRMHYASWDLQGRFLYTLDLGTDEIKVFETKNGLLTLQKTTKTQAGDGPRHLVFHPSLPLVYVLTELSNTIITYSQNIDNGALTVIDRSDALPSPKIADNFSSAIKLTKDGKFLYAAIRGSNMISVFSADLAGTLNFVQSHDALGNWPRDIELSEKEEKLLVANQRSNSVTVLNRDITTGELSASDVTLSVASPAFITKFAPAQSE